MDIRTIDDVEKFFDRFQDPSFEVEQICSALDALHHELQLHVYTDKAAKIKYEFVRQLIMKAYRLGKEHAYATSIETIRR